MYAAYSQYKVISNPTNLFISLDEVKKHLRLDPSDTSQDDYLTLLIKAATTFGEKYTRRIFINTNFRTYRDFFVPKIELRKSPFSALISFEYLKDNSWVTVSSDLYYITEETDYSKILLNNSSEYPNDIDERAQAIKIEFTAGFSDDVSTIYDPIKSDLIIAVLNHISALYENRGDCDEASLQSNLPNTSKVIYDQYILLDLIGETDYFYY